MGGVPIDDAQLDAIAAAAWPARVVEHVGPWRCRYTDGFTNRANSVAVLGRADPSDVLRLIKEAEDFYERHAARSKFQVSLTPRNQATIAALGDAEYVASPEVQVMVASLSPGSIPSEVTVAREPTSAWFETWWQVGDRGGDRERRAANGLLRRMNDQGFATVTQPGGRAIAVGLGQHQDGWLGVFAMSTLPGQRRRGHARRILDALCSWGYERGARRAYLQVPVASKAARELYCRASFVDAYRYAYFLRTQER